MKQCNCKYCLENKPKGIRQLMEEDNTLAYEIYSAKTLEEVLRSLAANPKPTDDTLSWEGLY